MEHFREDIREHEGRQYRVRYFYDTDHEAPWDDSDGRGIVRVTGHTADKKPGWRLLHSNRGDAWWFDWAGTIKKAEQEGWGLGGEEGDAMRRDGATQRQMRERAVQNEYDFFRAYLRDEWYYCGIEVTLLDDDGEPDEDLRDSCWGFETWNDYEVEAAQEMVENLAVRVKRVKHERAEKEVLDAKIREQARDGGCDLIIHDDAEVRDAGNGYWVAAELFVYKD